MPTTSPDGFVYPDSAGGVSLWTHFANLADSLQAKFAALEAWTVWTPIWIDGPVTIGAGGQNVGRYRRMGKFCEAWFRAELGTGFVMNSTTFELTLPFNADVSWLQGNKKLAIGAWEVRDESVTDHFGGTISIHDSVGDTVDFAGAWSTSASKDSTRVSSEVGKPQTWAAGDVISGHMSYRTV